MTVNISSLQNELLKLINKEQTDEDFVYNESNSLKGGNQIPIENILSASNTSNSDLSGGDNISGMVENILTGGNITNTTEEKNDEEKDKIDNNTSDKEIFTNILLEDTPTADTKDESNNTLDAETISNILLEDNKPLEGGNKQDKEKEHLEEESDTSSDDEEENEEESDTSSEEENEEDNNIEDIIDTDNDENNDEDNDDSDTDSEESEEESEDDEDNKLKSEYIKIINEFNAPASKLTGGLVGGNNEQSRVQPSRVKVISMFPYIVKLQ